MNCKFGVEIEAYNVTNLNELAAELTANGFTTVNIGYTHRVSETWKIVRDSSICLSDGSTAPGAFELVSPILEGSAGLEALAGVMAILNRMGAKVNKSCGLHLHINASDMSVSDIKQIYKKWIHCEELIDLFQPESRRANNNGYCRSVYSRFSNKLSAIETLDSCYTVHEIASVFAASNRYVKLNIQSYARQGTIEFRGHGGTLNGEKAVNWVKFIQKFCASAIAGTYYRKQGTIGERFNSMFSSLRIYDDNVPSSLSVTMNAGSSTKLKDIKNEVFGLLGFSKTSEVKKWLKARGIEIDLRSKQSWISVLTRVSEGVNQENHWHNQNIQINQLRAFFRARTEQLGTAHVLSSQEVA